MSNHTKAGRRLSFRNHLAPFVMAELVRASKVGWAQWRRAKGLTGPWAIAGAFADGAYALARVVASPKAFVMPEENR